MNMLSVLFVFFSSFWIPSVNGKNFTTLDNDVLHSILKYLSTQQRTNKFRFINQKCNNLFRHINDPIIDNLELLQDSLQQLDKTEFDDGQIDIIDIIEQIHRSQVLNEQYLLKMPQLIQRWYHNAFNTNYNDTKLQKIEELTKTLDFDRLFYDGCINHTLFKTLDDATKSLIRSSREITSGFIYLFQSEHDKVWVNCMRLLYMHCFEYLSNNKQSLLTSLDSVYYLNDNDNKEKHINYLMYLMSEYGLVLWHKHYLNIKWSDLDLNLYMKCYWKIISMVGNDERFIIAFNVKFIIKILDDIKDTQSLFEELDFLNIVTQTIIDLYDNGSNDLLELLLFAIKRRNTFQLLQYIGFDLFIGGLIYQKEEYVVEFLSSLCYVIIDGNHRNSSDIINRRRSILMARSMSRWFHKSKLASMVMIRSLGNDELFDPYLIQTIIIIHEVYGLTQQSFINHLRNVIINLCRKRCDWDFKYMSQQNWSIDLSTCSCVRNAVNSQMQ